MNDFLLLFGLGTQELILIALLVLLLFGAAKIPELMKSLGKGIKSFKKEMNGLDENGDSDAKTFEKDA